jgi:hypothetical protein
LETDWPEALFVDCFSRGRERRGESASVRGTVMGKWEGCKGAIKVMNTYLSKGIG